MERYEVIDTINYLQKYRTETNQIEAKSAKVDFPKKCYDTISSFSNKYGGIIIFGISENDDFSIEGVYDLNDLQKHISEICSDSMEPSVRPDIMPLEYEGKNILAVKIDELPQNKKPCYYKPKGLKNGSYTRIGDRDELMSDYEIYAMQSYNEHIFEDTRPNKRATLEDLDIDALNNYVIKVKLDKPHFSNSSFDKILKLSGITDGSGVNTFPTLAGTLIFSNYPQAFYPQLFVACVVVPGLKLGDVGASGERFIDNKRIEGNIEQMLDGTMSFLNINMKTKVTITSEGTRINQTEYPLEALREAVANALIHRDYSSKTESAYISVYMYSDRVEIISPGALYGINKLDKLGSETSMESRNPTIVRLLEEKEVIVENRHTGIPTMISEMKKYDLPEPEFYEGTDCFKVIFRKNMDSDQQQISGQGGQVSGQVSGQVGGQVSEQVLEHQKLVLEYCVTPKSTSEIKDYIKLNSRRYVRENIIKPLINAGYLDYTNKKHVNARNQKYITKK